MLSSPLASSRPAAESWRFTLRHLFAWIAGIALLLAGTRALWLAIGAARGAAQRSVEAGHCFKVVFALHMLAETEPHLPYPVQRQDNSDPQSEPLCSWRVLLPAVYSNNLAPDLTSRWDSSSNARFANWDSNIFAAEPDGPRAQTTRFLAITGPGTAFGDGVSRPMALRDVPGDTILIVETRNSGLHWMQPGDFDIRTMPRTINAADGTGISGSSQHGFLVGFADARYWRLSNATPFETLSLFFTTAGAEANDVDELLGPYRVN